VYGWLWRRLPGSAAARTVQLIAAAAAAGLLLWRVVYPWAAVHLPLDPAGLR
jgi:hypothetical protein